jgi:hypothetical protein
VPALETRRLEVPSLAAIAPLAADEITIAPIDITPLDPEPPGGDKPKEPQS